MSLRLPPWLSKERELKMIWRLEKGGRRSYLVGSAHFFPYHFRRSLRDYIGRVKTVLVEGPLDEGASARVVAHGSERPAGVSLLAALDQQTIARIRRELGGPGGGGGSSAFLRHVVGAGTPQIDWEELGRIRPWMAFFHVWSHVLRRGGWTYTIELDAMRIAGEAGKEVRFLEAIEEQLEALDGVPLERFVHFLREVDWRQSRQALLRHYLGGNLAAYLAEIEHFPTFCEAIVAKRDPVLYARVKGFFEEGNSLALVGTAHCRGITALLRADGFRVEGPEGS